MAQEEGVTEPTQPNTDSADPGTQTAGQGAQTVYPDPQTPAEPAQGEPNGEVVEYTDFKLPEGMTMDKGLLDAAIPVLKELKAPQEAAQKLVDSYASQLKAQTEQRTKAYNDQRQGWMEALEKDPDIGGAKIDENFTVADNALKAIDTDGELSKFIEDSGLGAYPPLVKALFRLGKMLSEDTLVGNTVSGGEGAVDKNAAQTLYPDQGKT